MRVIKKLYFVIVLECVKSYLLIYFILFLSAPCTVDIQRGRILYKGSKKWIENFTPNQVLHLEEVAVYCLNKQENCGYPVSMQCNDGHMTTPSCYEGA